MREANVSASISGSSPRQSSLYSPSSWSAATRRARASQSAVARQSSCACASASSSSCSSFASMKTSISRPAQLALPAYCRSFVSRASWPSTASTNDAGGAGVRVFVSSSTTSSSSAWRACGGEAGGPSFTRARNVSPGARRASSASFSAPGARRRTLRSSPATSPLLSRQPASGTISSVRPFASAPSSIAPSRCTVPVTSVSGAVAKYVSSSASSARDLAPISSSTACAVMQAANSSSAAASLRKCMSWFQSSTPRIFSCPARGGNPAWHQCNGNERTGRATRARGRLAAMLRSTP